MLYKIGNEWIDAENEDELKEAIELLDIDEAAADAEAVDGNGVETIYNIAL